MEVVGTSLFCPEAQMSKLQKLRERAFARQGGACFYCGCQMWLAGPSTESQSRKKASRRLLACTAEHLQARRSGGRDFDGNIVAACLFCNQTRHKSKNPLEPLAYKARVQQRLARGKWHGLNHLDALGLRRLE